MSSIFGKVHTLVSLIKENKFRRVLTGRVRILYEKMYMKNLSQRVISIDEDEFYIRLGNPGITRLFEYERDDSQRIRNGERKILFYCDENGGLDVKGIWERERLHELLPYVVYADKKDSYDFIVASVRQTEENIFHNTNAMEVAITAVNVIEACKAVNQQILLKDRQVCEFLRKCLVYILGHPEMGDVYSANHYFFNLVGASWIINHCIAENRNQSGIGALIEKRLERVLNQIISIDGSLYEGSTFYHRYVTESLLAYLYCNSKLTDKRLTDIARKMTAFAVSVSDGDTIFGFGDNDSGRILPIPDYFNYSSRSTFPLKKLYQAMFGHNHLYVMPAYLDYFGLIIFHSQNYCLAFRVDEGKDKKKNKFIGVHTHNDLLAVELNFFHKNVVINRGTYLYIQENNYRYKNLCTEYQSTVCIDGEEQNTISNTWIYKERKNLCKLIGMYPNSVMAKFKYASGIIHKRIIWTEKLRIGIIDELDCLNDKKATAFYYLSQDVEAELVNDKVEIKINGRRIVVSTDGILHLEACDIYPEYGMRLKSKVIRIEFSHNKINTIFSIKD